ncbi:MAG: Wzz/FepE/Etk N-terminal domain-containing protein [Elusimicrobiota bacterium]|nr:Wzz/FepE/Etk N-terminal domain-containing protein [Elusimicrobiota bacterium]
MEENEINLREYLLVIKKRWLQIFLIIFVATLTSGIVVLTLPRLYESNAILKHAHVGEKIVESTDATETLLKNTNNPYLRDIALKLYNNSAEKICRRIGRQFKLLDQTGFLRITAKEQTPEKAIQFVSILTEIIVTRHNHLLEKEKKILNAEISALQEQLNKIDKTIVTYDKLIKSSSKSTNPAETIITQAYLDASEKALMSYNEIFSKFKAKEILLELKTEPTEIIAEPSKIETPIYPKRKKVVIITFAISFVVSIFSAFFVEFLSKEKII